MPTPFDAPELAESSRRATSSSTGAIPEAGFNALVPELDVSDLPTSLDFWRRLLGFEVAYDRPAARFAYLVRDRIQMMLCQRNGNWEVGELTPPFGRGVNFQMTIDELTPILVALQLAQWPLFRPPYDAWYRAGDREVGQREFLVQDPDGYLLRFAQDIGTRPIGENCRGHNPVPLSCP